MLDTASTNAPWNNTAPSAALEYERPEKDEFVRAKFGRVLDRLLPLIPLDEQSGVLAHIDTIAETNPGVTAALIELEMVRFLDPIALDLYRAALPGWRTKRRWHTRLA